MNSKVSTFIRLANHDLSYNYELKEAFHKEGQKLLKVIANKMGLKNYEIRNNRGGVAVSGEVTLHGEHIYVQFGQSLTGLGFMYRQCNGLKDYVGGRNHWMQYEKLQNLDLVIEQLKRVSDPNS